MIYPNEYIPASISHPGETLEEKLEELGIGPKELAVRTGKPEKTISNVIHGKSSITSDMAVLFEKVLGIPYHFWMNRQQQYDEAIARQKERERIEEAKGWEKRFPYAQMAKLGWVPPTRKPEEKIEALFTFFGISDHKAFQAYYFGEALKTSFRLSLKNTREPEALAAWLCRGEQQARATEAPVYDKQMLKDELSTIKRLMARQHENFFSELQAICLRAGVKLVHTPCLPRAPVHGSTRWIGDNPIIQLSNRYQRNDMFWFTFFHEVGHILLHGKKYISVESDNFFDNNARLETEADEFAKKWTLTEKEEEVVLNDPGFTMEKINAYAQQFNTHPAVITGRLAKRGHLSHKTGWQWGVYEKIDLG